MPLSARVRIGLSVLILAHLFAVVLPPLSFQTAGSLGQSPAVATLLRPVEPYTQFLYIDRGYAFFAPDPGPSHLVQAAITDGSGETIEVTFPDREKQWPRLLYHRYFMLTEFLDEIYFPPGPPPELAEIDQAEAELWERQRSRYEHVRQSYIEHLKHVNPGKDVAIGRRERLIPGILEFQREPIALNDPRLLRIIPDVPVLLDGDETLTAPPETIPPPVGAAMEPAGTTMKRGTVADVEKEKKNTQEDFGPESDTPSQESTESEIGTPNDSKSKPEVAEEAEAEVAVP